MADDLERTSVTETSQLDWTELDQKAVDTARVLAMDAVQKVGNGHPGTAMSLAPAAYLLFQKVMRHNPADPSWAGRDRFVLSAGHSSITLYTELFLGGWGLEIEDLRSLRTWGSKTPGHPEHGHTAGVETTTGPLGQGVGNAVGMAMAARRERGLLDPSAAEGDSPFDHHIYCICSDGDLEEGVSAEAASIAGVQQLGNLTLIYDANRISIEGDTDVAFTEDVGKRFEAYGWHVQTVDWTHDGTTYEEDVPQLHDALRKAEAVTDQPSMIVLRTVIAWPAPNAQGTGKAHGAALGEEEVAAP
jgi:transketolase